MPKMLLFLETKIFVLNVRWYLFIQNSYLGWNIATIEELKQFREMWSNAKASLECQYAYSDGMIIRYDRVMDNIIKRVLSTKSTKNHT